MYSSNKQNGFCMGFMMSHHEEKMEQLFSLGSMITISNILSLLQPTWSNLHNFKRFCCVQQISLNVHSLKRFHYVQQTSSNVYGLKRFSYVQQTSLNIHGLERFRYVQQTSSQGVYPSVSKWASVEGPWVSHFTENLFIVSQNSTFE